MKIEKVNEHQIRCTLTREDLASRSLKISELAYGSDKAKDLFRDMMEKANDEYGFEADNIPLMIEAIPLNSECIVLIITKVDDPEELDTRFSKFAPGLHDSDSDGSDDDDLASDDFPATSIDDLFNKFKNTVSDVKKAKADKASENASQQGSFEGMAFSFNSVSELAPLCKNAISFFNGCSSFYRDPQTDRYFLTITRGRMDVADFVSVCNLFSEYGTPQRGRSISEAYLREHYEVICLGNAVETLSSLA